MQVMQKSERISQVDSPALEPLLTASELAAWLGVPIGTLYAWRAHRKGPPSLRPGRELRYRRQDVEDWLTGKTRDGR
jgi:excisionase family DNA binding protein